MVEGQIADAEHIRARLVAGAATQHGLHARDDLARAERLGDVVVGADLEADEPVDLVGARRHEDDGDALGLEAPRQLEAVDTRQHDVDQCEVDAVLGGRRDRGGAVGCRDGRVAVGAQVLGEHRDDLLVVVDHENGRHLIPPKRGCLTKERGPDREYPTAGTRLCS